jgi:hypothetical protein
VVEAGDGIDQHVEALAGDEAAQPEHDRPVGRDAEPATHRVAVTSRERTEAVGVDTRRDDQSRDRSSGDTVGDGGGILAGRDDTRRAAQHAADEPPAPGQARRHGDLGAVGDHDVRRGV